MRKGLGIRSEASKKLDRFLKVAQEDLDEEMDVEEEELADEEETEEEEEELDEEAEEEAEEEEEPTLESLSEEVGELEDSLSTVVDSLEEHKEILEKLAPEEVAEPAMDEFEDAQEEFGEDEFSAEEFGIDTDSLVTSKEGSMDLRKARKVRIQKAKKGAIEPPRKEKGPETFGEDVGEPESTKKTFKPITPPVEITKVKESEVPSMLKLSNLSLDLDEQKKVWNVVDENDKPHYTIAYDKKYGDKFATKEFAVEVIKAMKADGVEVALKKYNATAIEQVATPEVTPVIEKVEEKPVEKAVEQPVVQPVATITAADVTRKFVRAFKVVLSAMQKNLIPSPLKASFFDALKDCGMKEREAALVVESAFAKGALDHFERAINETDKYLKLSDEAFVEMESTIGEMQTKPVSVEAEEEETGEALRKRASDNSLPLSTASSVEASDSFAQLQSIVNANCAPKLAGISQLGRVR